MIRRVISTGTQSRVRRYLSFFGVLALWIIVAFNAWVLWPTSLGGSTSFVIVSGESMEPLYTPGDLVVARKGAPAIGDVVVYRPDGLGDAKVVHKIVGGNGVSGWDVKGVNNAWLDQWHPTNADVVGVVVLHVGKGNGIGAVFLSPLFWGAFLLVAVVLLLWPLKRGDRDKPDAAAPKSVAPGRDATATRGASD